MKTALEYGYVLKPLNHGRCRVGDNVENLYRWSLLTAEPVKKQVKKWTPQ
jgi:hypothetical protein